MIWELFEIIKGKKKSKVKADIKPRRVISNIKRKNN